MVLGLHGHPGAAAASLVVKEQPLERVPALLPRLGGSPVWEMVKKVNAAKLGNAQVGENPVSYCQIYLRNSFGDKLNTDSCSQLVNLGILEQLH